MEITTSEKKARGSHTYFGENFFCIIFERLRITVSKKELRVNIRFIIAVFERGKLLDTTLKSTDNTNMMKQRDLILFEYLYSYFCR